MNPIPAIESPIIRRALAWKSYDAKSIEDAVELATRFKDEGKYDWFRGQRKKWPLYPSAARKGIDPCTQQEITDEHILLLSWLRRIPGFSKIAEDIDAVLSIAQHYGLRTSLLDFTTDPGIAGFFACSEKRNEMGNGYIYCLNTDDLRRVDRELREYSPEYRTTAEIDFIRPDVPNLWRMEAQHGAFLYAPSNLFDYYIVDEIVFPHPSPLSFPTARDVYPERKSPLELELDHFFAILQNSRWHDAFRKQFPDAKSFVIKAPRNGVHPEFFNEGTLPKLDCWNKSRTKLWQRVPSERMRDTALGEIGLNVDLRMEASVLRARVSFGVMRALCADPSLRKRAVNWVLLPQRRLQAKLVEKIDKIWNGMRSLPYDDSVIADAIGLCFALHRCGFGHATHDEAQSVASQLLGDSIRIGMSDGNGSSSYGYVAIESLQGALRGDMGDRLHISHLHRASSPFALLQMCSSPTRLFRFEEFSRLFGSQVVPMQVMSEETSAVFFSPVRIKGFGLP